MRGFGEERRQCVACVAGRGGDGGEMKPKDIGGAEDGAAADQMAVAVINCLQAVEIEEQDGERTAGAVGAFRLVFQNVEESAVVGETGEGIADRTMVDLLEEPGVLKKSAT